MAWIEVEGAYGREYKNQKEIRADWNANKDFRGLGLDTRVLNKSDAKDLGLNVIVRYGKNLEKVCGVKND